MGSTLSEKLLAYNSGLNSVRAGDIVTVKVGCAMMHDGLGPWIVGPKFQKLEEKGAKIWDIDKVVVVSDHLTPACTKEQSEIVKYTRTWAREHHIQNYFEGQGPCHQVLAENGFDFPGIVLVGTDSHTCTAGAFGCFGTGIGSTEMVGVIATGEIWLRVPASVRIEWNGALNEGVMAKDIILRTLRDIGHAGATYKALEFHGEAIRALPMDERICISNMAVEAGAKVGLMEADEVTDAYLRNAGIAGPIEHTLADTDAGYEKRYVYDASSLVPQIACPHAVDNVCDLTDAAGIPIHQAYIGSCTGGRLSDLAAAAEMLQGKKVCSGTRLLVSPASRKVFEAAMEKGYIQTLSKAGAIILAPSCGCCTGKHSGVIAAGENCISTTNRNFKGRMGSYDSFVYLASARSVAAAAITGKTTDPRMI